MDRLKKQINKGHNNKICMENKFNNKINRAYD